jgi:polysaccharide pyruvyl transferase WcaK-like protein
LAKLKKLKIGLVGWNGRRNIGDDAMTLALMRFISFKEPDCEFVLLCDKKTLPVFGIENEAERIKTFRWYNATSSIKGLRRLFVGFIYPFMLASQKPDILIFGGGSIFQFAKVIKQFTRIARWCKIFNPDVRIHLRSVSIGPFEDDNARANMKELLLYTNDAVVRDLRSRDLLKSVEKESSAFSFAPDAAFAVCSLLDKCSFQKENGSIAVSVRSNKADQSEFELIKKLINILNNRIEVMTVYIIDFCDYKHHSDSPLSDALENYLKDGSFKVVRIPYSSNPLDCYWLLSKMEFVIAMRLHAAIISVAMKTMPLIIPYHAKSTDIGKQVLKLPENGFFYSVDSKAVLKQKINSLMGSYELDVISDRLVKDALMNFDSIV